MVVVPANPGAGWMDTRRSPELTLITAEPDLATLLSELSKDGWEAAEMLMPPSRRDRVIFQRLRATTPAQPTATREPLTTARDGAFG